MENVVPPFKVDVAGTFLLPAALREAREQYRNEQISESGRSSDLASIPNAFPTTRVSGQRVSCRNVYNKASQQRDCPGVTPDSLLIAQSRKASANQSADKYKNNKSDICVQHDTFFNQSLRPGKIKALSGRNRAFISTEQKLGFHSNVTGLIADLYSGEIASRSSRTINISGVKVAYDFKLYKSVDLQLSAGVQNVFNAYQNDFDQGVERDSGYIYGPAAPRSYFARIKISY